MDKKNFIKIVNNNQFEIKVKYLANKDIKKINYNINTYFFIPKNLNINSRTYHKDDFYSEYTSYIRLITPKNELGILKKKFILLFEKFTSNKIENITFEKEIKLIVCSYVSYIRTLNVKLLHKDIKIKRLKVLVKRLNEFNEIKERLIKLSKDTKIENTKFFLESTAEYLSLSTQHYLFQINIKLKNYSKKYFEIINEIINIINIEILFCKKNKFPIISNNEYQNEKVIYRYSILKKYFYGVLNLFQTRKKDGASLKEFYYAIAAGISMIFTTIILFIIQREYGNLTTSLFVALIISYMFKDRIKEAYRSYFDKKIALKTYDFKEKIYNKSKKLLFAFIKEKMRFCEKENISDDVIQTRLKGVPKRLSALYIDEDIIKYEKDITLYNKNIQNHYNNTINGIHNIMRFDISKFLKKMNSAKIPLYRINGSKLFGNKVYHVNLVIEFKTNNETKYYKARLILNKRGIKRIELPEQDIKLFLKDRYENKKNWFNFKKSGLIKNTILKTISKNNEEVKLTSPKTVENIIQIDSKEESK